MIDIAVFPIPNCVSFPGTRIPLHVFEPRYRKLVQYCVDSKTPLAVCHTEKVLQPSKPNQNLSEALQSNQATYKPVLVCSAGQCDLIDTLADGRMMIEVYMEKRYRLINEIQTLPFILYQGEEFTDIQLSPTGIFEANELKDKILHRLIALCSNMPELVTELESPQWQEKSLEKFSFELFGILQIEGDSMQKILEMNSPLERLKTTLTLLNHIQAQIQK